MLRSAIASLFLRAWKIPPPSSEEIEARLAEAWQVAQSAHPGIAIPEDAFVRHLAIHVDTNKPPLEALAALRTDDLYLALACGMGDRQALLRFESECIRRAERGLTKRGLSDDAVEEAKQIIRERLLVAGGSPRILEFDGQGHLRHWVRVAVLREAIQLSKRERRDVPLTFELLSVPDGDATDPEIAYFKKRYRSDYKEAIETALVDLPERERDLLRQQYLLGLTVDEVGAIYEVHRATAARWLQKAREELITKARLELARRLGLTQVEMESIVRTIETDLDISLQRILAARPPSDPPSG